MLTLRAPGDTGLEAAYATAQQQATKSSAAVTSLEVDKTTLVQSQQQLQQQLDTSLQQLKTAQAELEQQVTQQDSLRSECDQQMALCAQLETDLDSKLHSEMSLQAQLDTQHKSLLQLQRQLTQAADAVDKHQQLHQEAQAQLALKQTRLNVSLESVQHLTQQLATQTELVSVTLEDKSQLQGLHEARTIQLQQAQQELVFKEDACQELQDQVKQTSDLLRTAKKQLGSQYTEQQSLQQRLKQLQVNVTQAQTECESSMQTQRDLQQQLTAKQASLAETCAMLTHAESTQAELQVQLDAQACELNKTTNGMVASQQAMKEVQRQLNASTHESDRFQQQLQECVADLQQLHSEHQQQSLQLAELHSRLTDSSAAHQTAQAECAAKSAEIGQLVSAAEQDAAKANVEAEEQEQCMQALLHEQSTCQAELTRVTTDLTASSHSRDQLAGQLKTDLAEAQSASEYLQAKVESLTQARSELTIAHNVTLVQVDRLQEESANKSRACTELQAAYDNKLGDLIRAEAQLTQSKQQQQALEAAASTDAGTIQQLQADVFSKSAAFAKAAAEAAQLQAQLGEVQHTQQEEYAQLTHSLDSAEAAASATIGQLSEANAAVAHLQAELKTAQHTQHNALHSIARLQQQLQSSQSTAQQQQQELQNQAETISKLKSDAVACGTLSDQLTADVASSLEAMHELKLDISTKSEHIQQLQAQIRHQAERNSVIEAHVANAVREAAQAMDDAQAVAATRQELETALRSKTALLQHLTEQLESKAQTISNQQASLGKLHEQLSGAHELRQAQAEMQAKHAQQVRQASACTVLSSILFGSASHTKGLLLSWQRVNSCLCYCEYADRQLQHMLENHAHHLSYSLS